MAPIAIKIIKIALPIATGILSMAGSWWENRQLNEKIAKAVAEEVSKHV